MVMTENQGCGPQHTERKYHHHEHQPHVLGSKEEKQISEVALKTKQILKLQTKHHYHCQRFWIIEKHFIN